MDEAQIRERLVKIKALFEGATSDGERDAAEAALNRINLKMAQAQAQARGDSRAEEMRFSFSSAWSVRLFVALCRSKGLRPYRYARMRRTSLCVKVDAAVLDHQLWPEFLQMNSVLTQYLDQLADHIIGECINPDGADPELVAGLSAPSAGAERSG